MESSRVSKLKLRYSLEPLPWPRPGEQGCCPQFRASASWGKYGTFCWIRNPTSIDVVYHFDRFVQAPIPKCDPSISKGNQWSLSVSNKHGSAGHAGPIFPSHSFSETVSFHTDFLRSTPKTWPAGTERSDRRQVNGPTCGGSGLVLTPVMEARQTTSNDLFGCSVHDSISGLVTVCL